MKLTLAEQIIAFSGTGVGGALLGKWMNKKKDAIEITLQNQIFYKTLIADLSKQHDDEKLKISELKVKIENLTKEVHKLITVNKEKDIIIDQYKDNVKKWENNCIRLEAIIKDKDKIIISLSNDED